MKRLALLFATLLVASSCLSECQAVGRGGIGYGAIGSGAIGAGAIGGKAPEATGCSIAETPALHYAPRLQADCGGACSDTDPVSTIENQGSIGSYDLTAAGAERPAYIASDAVLGQPVLEHDSGEHLLGDDSLYTVLTFPVVACALQEPDSVSGNQSPFSLAEPSSVDDVYLYNNTSTSRAAVDNVFPSSSSVVINQWHVHCVTIEADLDSYVTWDGTQGTTQTAAAPKPTGARWGTNHVDSMPFDGRLAEAIVFAATSLTAADVKTYWECVYGVTFPAS